MAGFAPEEVEDGTGRSTAIVYDNVDAAKAWLDRRGLTAFGLADEDVQKAALVRATDAAEDAIRQHVRLVHFEPTQALLFPGVGAYDSSGRLMEENERPLIYRQGIFLLAAEIIAGTFMQVAKTPLNIASESSRRGSITYRQGVNPGSLAANHSEAWSKISFVIPQL